ncbi:MAG TPA: hypothetical protein VM073_07135 [Usitatibacter sp.]|nr:hypothetical protein [Usitatibacter sp.]
MDFKDKYPDFANVEALVKRARAERQVAIATAFTNGIMALVDGTRRLAGALGSNLAAERDRRAIESDAFLKRSVPKY